MRSTCVSAFCMHHNNGDAYHSPVSVYASVSRLCLGVSSDPSRKHVMAVCRDIGIIESVIAYLW